MAYSKDPVDLNVANARCVEIIRGFFNDPQRKNEECDIEVQTRLEKIFEYVNDTTSESTIQTKWIKGLWDSQQEHQVDRFAQFLPSINQSVILDIVPYQDVYSEPLPAQPRLKRTVLLDTDFSVKGVSFKILHVEADFEYTGNGNNCKRVLSEQEIYDSKEMIAKVRIAQKSKLIRWQLVTHILGHDIGHDHIIDTDDKDPDKFTFTCSGSVAKILVPLKIIYGQTPVRIKHKAQDKFLTVVTRKGWPAAALGLNSQFYFVLHKTPEGIRIEAKNTTVPDYDVLYSSYAGAIYFDRRTTGLSKQCWAISKEDPLFNGNTVSFTNKWWNDSALCSDNGTVSCTRNREDEWILITD